MGGFLCAYLGRIFFNAWGTILSSQATQKMSSESDFVYSVNCKGCPAEYHEKNSVWKSASPSRVRREPGWRNNRTDHQRFASYCYYHCANFSDDGGLEPALDSDCYTVSAGLLTTSPSIPATSPATVLMWSNTQKGKETHFLRIRSLVLPRCNSSAEADRSLQVHQTLCARDT